MGKTLWQRFTKRVGDWWSPPPPEKIAEELVFNPLNLRIGGSVTVDELDWNDLMFFVKEIKQYKRSDANTFSDYVICAKPIDKPEIWARIRCFALPNASHGETPYQTILLTLYDEFPWNDGILKVLNDTTKKFEFFVDDKLEETYFRMGGLSEPCRSFIDTVGLFNGKSKLVTQREAYDYWDYSRTAKDEADQDYELYAFVEQNLKTSWFQIWKGHELNPERVLSM